MDVSVILNVHDEQDLLYPTLRSLSDTVDHAHLHGIQSELVVVADCVDETTQKIIDEYDYSCFDAVKIQYVQVASLGLARNIGIQAACGTYIVPADADDLVSRNFIYQLYQKHQNSDNQKIICFPEYYHAFGDENYLCRFYPLAQVGLYRLAGEHTYVSRFMARREALLEVPFRDCTKHSLYAYEDYDLNIRMVCAGFDLVVAEDTIVFYRQRSGSIMASLGKEQKHMGFNSEFFHGPEFLALLKQHDKTTIIPQQHLDFKKYYTQSSYIREFIRLANKMEPEIHPRLLWDAKCFTNVGLSEAFGRVYEKICQSLKNKQYTDVFFLPFLSKGGGEKYVLNFIQTAMKEEKKSCLLVLGQKLPPSKGQCRTPENLDVIDLPALFAEDHVEHQLMDDLLPQMVVRMMENFAVDARIFMVFCPFVVSLMKAYPKYFGEHQLIYFYFCNSYYILDGAIYEDGDHYRFLFDYKRHINYVVSDHRANLAQLEKQIPLYQGKTKTLYTYSQAPDFTLQPHAWPRRLIWASRLDSQKRPDLLRAIASKLRSEANETEIYVYGSSVLDNIDEDYFRDYPNIIYKGKFSGLSSIPFTDKDAFLYTSLFDGLPNVLLEAAQMGVPVITTDVGGVPELVSDQSAFVVRNCVDDVELVERYVVKIKDFLNAPEHELQEKSRLLKECFEHQHAYLLYEQNVSAFYTSLEEQRAKEVMQ
ncbi:hypothetical protein AA0473_0759 [Acetobacter orleanensis NRIC 0473]|nr:hypothetical protein AD949_02420 [Acetobacter orleanensis]GBR24916.1 hypothetical protein AA0473_0759 [Acetobacter orleanensis NRIC 0473]